MWNKAVLICVIFCIILLCAYCILLLVYRKWFLRLTVFKPLPFASPANKFSVIISARDEEDSIEACLHSVLQNDYPSTLFEVILVDDFSTDATVAIVKQLQQQYTNLHLIQLEEIVKSKLNSYKKKAIEIAISAAKNDWIITTDADCMVTLKWLAIYNSFIIQTNSFFIAAPVIFSNDNSFLSVFQCLDFMSLQGITAASVSAGFSSMSNGANLCYKKLLFNEVDGFSGIDNIASGDDMLLMHKIQQKYSQKIHYLFSQQAIVQTLPMKDWKSFINQRIRWASKATKYSDKKVFYVLLLVYLLNFSLLIFFILCIFFNDMFYLWFTFLICKTIFELIFLLPVAKFFNQKKLLLWFPFMQPFHILYTVIAGFLGNFVQYKWKGRTVK